MYNIKKIFIFILFLNFNNVSAIDEKFHVCLYKKDLDEITSKIFGRCADERYVLEFGEDYNRFLELEIRDKIRLQINYEWFVEECEEEYRAYPIKFKLKYFDYL